MSSDHTHHTHIPPLDSGGGRSDFGFLLDMDGVIYRGDQLVPGADVFIQRLQDEGIPFLFLTNNSANTPRDYVVKLAKFGIHVDDQCFYTCAMATVDFLRIVQPEGTAYVIGEGGILTALYDANYGITTKNPDFVIVGEGRTLNYEMLERAQNMVLNGARLIATNLDTTCPMQTGYRPGAGALVMALEAATGVKAYSVGKPSAFMMRAARKRLKLSTAQTIMVGDTMETDVRGSMELGFMSILVLTGNTSLDDLMRFPYRPSVIYDSVAHIDIDDTRRSVRRRLQSDSAFPSSSATSTKTGPRVATVS